MGGVPLHIDHVGSTSVPGLAAKDCIDVQIRVRSIVRPRSDQGVRHRSPDGCGRAVS
ncbi:GrpB family protein [Streptomyces sp. NPDC055144]